MQLLEYETVDLEGIENFPELEEIFIYDSIPINYESLTKLPNLKMLTFTVPNESTDLYFLIEIQNIERLGLIANTKRDDYWKSENFFELDIIFLRSLKKLQNIYFQWFSIKNFNVLSELPELNNILIRDAATSDADYSLFRDDVNIIDYYDH